MSQQQPAFGSVLISGHARFPEESAAKKVYDVLTLTAEVEVKNWVVVAADITLITNVARQFVLRRIVNLPLCDTAAVDEVVADLEQSYQAGAKRAVITALLNLQRNAFSVKAKIEAPHASP